MKRLKIGVICEGQTDYHAISNFIPAALAAHGVEAEIVPLQPDMGRTMPDAGWPHLELWLQNNPPRQRVDEFLGGGPFAFEMSAKTCDVFLIQMDSDILDEESFRTYMLRQYQFIIPDDQEPDDRGRRVTEIHELWSRIGELTVVDRDRHVFAPAVESTEAWCVAAYHTNMRDIECLRGPALTQVFMSALEASEHRDVGVYAIIDKDVGRRARFCKGYEAAGAGPVMRGCPHFARAVTRLEALAV
jgi:hypothetical protein